MPGLPGCSTEFSLGSTSDTPDLATPYLHVISLLLHNTLKSSTRNLEKKCAAGRILGPFQSSPLPNFHCSGLGAVPKKGGKWRMTLHLSAPHNHSVNDFIPKEEFSLHYTSVDDAFQYLLNFGVRAQMAKIDLKSAFRMVPVHPDNWELLGMQWR